MPEFCWGIKRVAIGVIIGLASGCTSLVADTMAKHNPRRYEFSARHMGTEVKLTFYAADDQLAKLASAAALQRIAGLDERLSDYRPDSELMRLTAEGSSAYQRPVPVSEDLFCLLWTAAGFSDQTDGAFDVTIGPLSRRWRKARREGVLPTDAQIETARESVGHEALQLQCQRRTVHLTRSAMRLDLGGIAKGYAADEARATLAEHGIEQALVAVGGDLAVGEAPPGQRGWKIDVDPLATGDPIGWLECSRCGVSTSGDAQQHLEVDGQRFSHLIDPRTGRAVMDGWSVTVIAPSATKADALASTAAVLGPSSSVAPLQAHRASGCFVQRTSDGMQIEKIGSFPLIPLPACSDVSYPSLDDGNRPPRRGG